MSAPDKWRLVLVLDRLVDAAAKRSDSAEADKRKKQAAENRERMKKHFPDFRPLPTPAAAP